MLTRRFQHPASGFTLLEIILATAIAAIVLIAIQSVFFGALRLRNTTTAQINEGLSLQRTLAIVQRDLSGVMLPGGTLSGSLQTTPSSSTSDDSLGQRVSPDFYTSSGKIDGWNPFSEVQMVTYYLAPSTDGSSSHDLIRAVTRNLLPTEEATIEAKALMNGLAQVAFDYYNGAEWTDTWDSTQTVAGSSTLPTAVRVRLTLASAPGQPTREPIETIVPILPASVVTPTASSMGSGGGSL